MHKGESRGQPAAPGLLRALSQELEEKPRSCPKESSAFTLPPNKLPAEAGSLHPSDKSAQGKAQQLFGGLSSASFIAD